MMAFHQDGDVETYLLTIMNMVSSLYLDPTIGNFINVVVVRIILVEEDEAEVRADSRDLHNLASPLEHAREKFIENCRAAPLRLDSRKQSFTGRSVRFYEIHLKLHFPMDEVTRSRQK